MPKKHSQSNKMRKRKGKDLDEILENLKPEKVAKLKESFEPDIDLPGEGRFYCPTCTRHFTDVSTLEQHKKTKSHKRRLKALQEEPYTQKEAEAAVGAADYVRSKNSV